MIKDLFLCKVNLCPFFSYLMDGNLAIDLLFSVKSINTSFLKRLFVYLFPLVHFIFILTSWFLQTWRILYFHICRMLLLTNWNGKQHWIIVNLTFHLPVFHEKAFGVRQKKKEKANKKYFRRIIIFASYSYTYFLFMIYSVKFY